MSPVAPACLRPLPDMPQPPCPRPVTPPAGGRSPAPGQSCSLRGPCSLVPSHCPHSPMPRADCLSFLPRSESCSAGAQALCPDSHVPEAVQPEAEATFPGPGPLPWPSNSPPFLTVGFCSLGDSSQPQSYPGSAALSVTEPYARAQRKEPEDVSLKPISLGHACLADIHASLQNPCLHREASGAKTSSVCP